MFSTYNTLSSINRKFWFSLPVWMPFIYLFTYFCIITVDRTFSNMLNRSGRVGILVLLLLLEEKLSTLAIEYDASFGFIINGHYAEIRFHYSNYSESFLNMNGCWILLIFIHHFVNVVYHICWLTDMESHWIKSHMVMMYDSFCILLN